MVNVSTASRKDDHQRSAEARLPARAFALTSGGRTGSGKPSECRAPRAGGRGHWSPHVGVRPGWEAGWEAEGACGREHSLVIGDEHVEFAFELLGGCLTRGCAVCVSLRDGEPS